MKEVALPVTAILILLWVLVWPASEAWSGVSLPVLDSFGQFIWDSDSAGSSKHPKRAITSLAVLDRNFINEIGQYEYCFGYFRTTSKKPNRGKVRVTVEVIRSNGESTAIADLAGNVSDGFAFSCTPALLLPLEVGDIVVWRYRFRKMPRLKDAVGFALVIFEGLISSPSSPPIAASAEVRRHLGVVGVSAVGQVLVQ